MDSLVDLDEQVYASLPQLAEVPPPRPEREDPFEHPDAKRRFRVMNDVEELERDLEFPWERWTVFLHPEQRQLVERDYGGPFRVSGTAGTGKTVVALHRAAHLARMDPDARVLLTTFSDALANSLRTKLMRLISSEPRLAERLEVQSMDAIGGRLYRSNMGPVDIASRAVVRELLEASAATVEDHRFSLGFLLAEWEQGVDAWQVGTWEEYRDVRRLGRKTRLPEARRRVLWEIFAGIRSGLETRGLITRANMFTRLASHLQDVRHPPFDYAVVDEAQDVSVGQLRFLSALGAGPPERPVLRRGPGPEDLPATVLLEITGGRHPRAFPHPQGQLPHLAPDQDAGGPAPGFRGLRCGRRNGSAGRRSVGIQRP
jgi:hypothetical protein